jgi:hypothetical protein
MPTFQYTVDDEPQSTSEHILTARQILQNAGIDPSNHYLIEIEGQHKKSFEANPDEPIHMHERMKFISVFKGPTPVS